MLYRPKRIQYISAFKFKSYEDNNQFFLELLGIDKAPQGFYGRCQCGRPISEHGFYKNQLICPGIYIMYEGKQITSVMSADNFEDIYEPLFEEEES